jgi:hypothetical protein
MKLDHPSGIILKQNRNFSNFDGISLQTMGNLYITQGDSTSIVIETDNDIFPFITTFINGTTLYIGKNDNIMPTKLNIYITISNIKSIILEGSGNIYADKIIKNEGMIVILNGTGNIKLDSIYVNFIKFIVEGTGELLVKGVGKTAGASIHGSGNLKIMEFSINTLNATIEGSGNIYTCPLDVMSARIDGSGSIYYKGTPNKINKEINGTGKVVQLENSH